MLHLIFQSPIENAVLERMAIGDVAVFMGNAVLGLLQDGKSAQLLADKLAQHRFCVLSEDMAIRGVLESEIVRGIEFIDYAGLVQLTVENPLIQSWT